MEITETIKSYYENILQRPASDDEANFWAERVEAGEYDLGQIRDAFINSLEGQHVQDIIRLYQGSFNRVPDAGGLKGWVQSGLSLDEIAEGFTNSEEFNQLYETNEPTEAFITMLYRNVLGREPDPEGMTGWMNSNLSAHQILTGFTESVEFRGEAGAWVGKFLDRAGEGKSVFQGTLYNDAPIAGDPVALTPVTEDGGAVTITAAQLLANAWDYDADEVYVKSVVPTDPAAGVLEESGDGIWTFTPAADYHGTVTFDVVVTDGELDTPTSATLEVTADNDAPLISDVEPTRIGEEMATFGIMQADPLAVTQTAVVTDVEGNFAGGSIRIDVSGKIGDHTLVDGKIPLEDIGIFPAGAEDGEIVGKFYSVGSSLVMRAGVAGNDVDMVIGTYKAGFVDGQVEGQEGFGRHDAGEATFATVTLNANATAEIVTELLKNIRLGHVESAEGDLNVKVTVTDGDDASAEFTRLLDIDGRAQMTAKDEDSYVSIEEVEFSERLSHKLASKDIVFDSNGSVTNGATITVTGSNLADKLGLIATDASIEEGQARFILNVDGAYDVSIKIDEDEEIVIGTTASLPKAGDPLVITLNGNVTDDSMVDFLLNSLTVDMSDELGERTFTVVYESAKGPNDLVDIDIVPIEMTLTVVGDFEEVTLDELIEATDENPVTIASNTRIILSGTPELDIEQAIEDGKIIVSGEGHLIRLVSSTPADISGVTGLDKLGVYSFHEIGADLTISAEQGNNTKGNIAEGAKLIVTGVENLPGLDLSKLDGEGDIVAELDSGTGVTFSGDLGKASMTVTGAGELSVAANLATGKEITFDDGTIVITDLGTSPYDLTKVTADLVKAEVTSDLDLDKDTQLGSLELAVTQNATLTLTAAQADDRTITGGKVDGNGNKGASVIVTDLIDDTDLRDISGSEILIGATNATQSDLIVRVTGKEAAAEDGVLEVVGLNLGSFIVEIDEGATLKTDSASVDGEIIQGAGSIIVTAEGIGIEVDLSKIAVDGEKTLEVSADGNDQPSLDADAVIGDFKVVVANDATFSLTAVQVDGKTITGADAIAEDLDAEIAAADGGSVTVALSGGAAYDLSNVKAGAASAEAATDAGKLIAIATDNVEINSSSNLGDFEIILVDGADVPDLNASLTLSASQADGRVITVAPITIGSVTVTGLAADTDLSKVAVEATVTANVGDNLDISGNDKLAGYVDVYKVIDGKVLTLSALQANDIEISATHDSDNATADGTVVIAGDVAAAEDTNDNGSIDPDEAIVVDLTKVGLGLSFDDGSINVGNGVTLLLTAAQANGKVITGEGSVMVTGFDGTTIDLSKITVTGEKVVELGDSTTLSTGAKLGSFTLDLVDHELTVSSTQAASLDKIVDDEGTGTLIVHGTQTADNLDFSGKTDWNFGSLTLDGSGAADYLKAPPGVDSIVFVGGNGADNYDVQGDQQVMIADFNMQVDELSIAKDGVAIVSATGVADFAGVEAGNRLDNKGILAIWGSDGDDTITVSSGVNYLRGDEGDDTFIYTAARVDGDGPRVFDVIDGFGAGGEEDTIVTANALANAGGGVLGDNQYKLISGTWFEETGTFDEEPFPAEMSTKLIFDADGTKAGVQQTSIILVGVDPNDVSYAGGVFSHSIA